LYCLKGVVMNYLQRKKAFQNRWKVDSVRWSRFVEMRERLKGQGAEPQRAWVEAMDECEAMWLEEDEEGKEEPPSGLFVGKSCSRQRAVEWAAQNVLTSVGPGEAPSAEAWWLREYARRSNAHEVEFVRALYSKLLPSRQSLDREEKSSDRAEKVQGMIAEALRTAE
jgi:hypothetical protein